MNHKITGLTVQKRSHLRVNVFLDGEFAFGLTRFVAAWLEVGQEISDEKIAQLRDEDARETAYQQAIKFISYRPRTQAEISRNLGQHQVPQELINDTLERLRQAGLINDELFAQEWVENRNDLRPRSRRALAFELRQKGIDPLTVEQSLEEINDDELAYQAALQHASKLKNLEWQDFRQKMYGFLARRGFNYEVSQPAVSRVWTEIQAKSEDNLMNEEVYT
jgi:regulatory protein